MTPEELAAEIERLIVSNNTKFAGIIGKVQGTLYNKIIGILKGLELDGDGYIKQSTVNRKILREAQSIFDAVITNGPYQNAVESHLKVIPKIDALNVQYFESISDIFSPKRNFIKELQAQVIRDVNINLLNEGLIAQVKTPLNQILNQNINSGGSFSGFQQQIRNYILGNEKVEGRLLNYTKTMLSDTLFNYSRTWQDAVTNDLGLEFYLYAGGLTAGGKGSSGSREFCIERTGNFYHRKEIEAMADLQWKGRNPLTTKSSIFTLLGGYNCHHSVIPVSELIVPKEVIQRAIDAGYKKAA